MLESTELQEKNKDGVEEENNPPAVSVSSSDTWPVKDQKSEQDESVDKKVQFSPFLMSTVPKKDLKSDNKVDGRIDFEKVKEKQEQFLEENMKDGVFFKAKCKLYWLSGKTNRLEERGEGYILISMYAKKNLIRVVMFRDQVMRLGCNHFIDPRFELQQSKKSANAWVWASTGDTVEPDVKRDRNQTFFVKFYSEQDFKKFKEEYDIGRVHNKRVLEENKK